MGNEKTAVFEHALIQHINRKLSADAKQLQTARSFQLETSVGHYFIADLGDEIAHRRIARFSAKWEGRRLQVWR